MIITYVYEDNAGGLYAIAKDCGRVVGIVGGLEFERPETADFVRAAEDGFSDADPYNPDDWGGLSMQEAADSIEDYDGPGYNLIATISHDDITLYPDRMGYAGAQLFGADQD